MLERQVTLKKRIGTNIVSLFPTTTSELVKVGNANLDSELSNIKESINNHNTRLQNIESTINTINNSLIVSEPIISVDVVPRDLQSSTLTNLMSVAENDETYTESISAESTSFNTNYTVSTSCDTTNSALLNLPISSIIDYSANDLPNGYLYADGSKLLKTDYPDLYNAIGDTFTLQENIGTEYFNIPYVENLSDDVYKIIKVSKNSFVIDQVVYDDTNVVNSTVIANLLERIKVLEDALGI